MKRIESLITIVSIILLSACASSKVNSGNVTTTNPKNGTGNKILGSTTFPGGQPTNGEPFALTEVSTDASYGFKESNPIKVGGGIENGVLNERRFLNALAGPAGETIKYNRVGSCCPFKTPNGFSGSGLLDKYEIKWEGLDKPIYLYINLYDAGDLKIPVGFTTKK